MHNLPDAPGGLAASTENDSAPQDMHPADVMAALRKTTHGWSLRRLSLARGYSANAVGEALRRPWPAVESIIARELDMQPSEIWPSRYENDGTPKSGRSPSIFQAG